MKDVKINTLFLAPIIEEVNRIERICSILEKIYCHQLDLDALEDDFQSGFESFRIRRWSEEKKSVLRRDYLPHYIKSFEKRLESIENTRQRYYNDKLNDSRLGSSTDEKIAKCRSILSLFKIEKID